MLSFDQLSCGIAIRHILSIRDEHTQQFHAVFMIVDILEPDMQDYPADVANALKTKKPPFRSIASQSSNMYNAYLTSEYISIDKEFINDPTSNISYRGTPIDFICGSFQHIPRLDSVSLLLSSDESDAVLLRSVLPKRKCSSFVNIYRDTTREAQKLICKKENDYLQKQLTELTLKHLDFDICRFPELLGDVIFVRHHPLLRAFEVRATNSKPGILIQTSTANQASCKIKVRITDRYQNRIYLQHAEDEYDANERMHLIPLADCPSRIDVDVIDEDGTLILSHRDMPYIKSIAVNFAVESYELVLDKGSKEERVVPKFSTETSIINPQRDQTKHRFGEEDDTEGYKLLEENLTVAFFDGDKTQAGHDANIARAHDVLQKILNHSSRYLYIIDPYFEKKNLEDFIYPLRSADVQIRILSSKELTVEKACELRDAIELYNSQPASTKIECRLSRGDKPITHDRYLISEGLVWLMGCSFNEFASRATTIVKLPPAAARCIIESTEHWWYSESISCTLNSYAEKKNKSLCLIVFTILCHPLVVLRNGAIKGWRALWKQLKNVRKRLKN